MNAATIARRRIAGAWSSGSFHVLNPHFCSARRAALLLCSAFLTFTAGAAAPIELQQIALTPQHGQTASEGPPAPSHSRPGGRNRLVRPAHARDKFVPEVDRNGTDVYIVRLHDLPVATYDGRVHGLAATHGALHHSAGKQPNDNAA